MTVKLRFRDLSGQIINGSFPSNAKVEDVCCFLNKRLKSSSYIIYLISPNSKQLFYQNEESVQVLSKQKQKSIFFFKLKRQITTKRPDSQKKMITPPKSAMNAYNNFMEIKNIGREHRIFYFKYASVLNSVPDDMEEKVKQVAQFGYDKEDCREALRDAHFNVNDAVEILIRRHRNLTDEEANEPPPNLSTVMNFLRFMLLRGSHDSSDDDDSEDMEEEEDYSSDDSSTESINENENNQTNNNETESNNETNNQENTDNKNENQRILTPIPPSSASSSPRTSINRLLIDPTQAHESANQNSSDESEGQPHKIRPIIINPRLSRITRPNIQSNQRKITIPRNIQPKKSGK